MQVLRKAFNQQLNEALTEFVGSIDADQALIQVDIKGSIAHAAMLAQVGLLTDAQHANIENGLKQILTLTEKGEFVLNPVFEDVHMNVEKKLEQLIGEDALRLHTARSRNDQVALDLRLFVLSQIDSILVLLSHLQSSLAKAGLANIDVVMPGYTHLQRAQPVLFAHSLHAYVAMLERDKTRFVDARKRTAVSPLGAGAQAGSGLSIKPEISASLLELPAFFSNSMDAVSDRDFVAEFLFDCAMTAVHLSQLAETFIIWASSEFSFIKFSDAVTTASSLMPQKKNPDPVELVRGKTGAMLGELVNVMSTLKGLPLGYNRDLQETKPPAIKVAKELSAALLVMSVAIDNLSVCEDKMLEAASDPAMMSTDLVEFLVENGCPFRQAHEAVSSLVALSVSKGIPLSNLALEDFQKSAPQFTEKVFDLFDPACSVKAKKSTGSTAPAGVEKALKAVKESVHHN